MERKSFRAYVSGPLACFTRPEMKVERMSYDMMTQSAARGVLESILWKPAMRWCIHRIAVLSPINWISFRRNEVKKRAPKNPKPGSVLVVENERTQRNTVALRDVEYIITASIKLTDEAGPKDNQIKFEEMFERRLGKGQTFQQPYLGCREFVADVGPVHNEKEPIDFSRPLGLMFFDFDYSKDGVRPLFFDATLSRGILEVPSLEYVIKTNSSTGGYNNA